MNIIVCVCGVCVCRVLEQHKLTKEQWEDRIQTWHEEHRGMLRCVSDLYHDETLVDMFGFAIKYQRFKPT